MSEPAGRERLPEHRSFTVLDNGGEPRRVLRYDLADRDEVVRVTTQISSRELADGKWTERVTLPAMTTGFGLAIAGAKLVGRVLPATVAGEVTPAAQQYLAPWRAIEGRRVAIEVDTRGVVRGVTFPDDPQGTRSEVAIDDITQRLLGSFVPLPDEPVGAGATWRAVTILRQRPVIVKQTAVYKLVELGPQAWKIEVDLRRVGEPQTIDDPAVPRETTVELVLLVRTLKGTVEVAPTAVMPAGTLAVESTMHLRLDNKVTGPAEQIFEDGGTVELAHGK